MRDGVGITLLETLIAVAIAGVLFALAASRVNPAGTATRQAAEVVAATINRARYEAIRTNQTAGLVITAGAGGSSGSVYICRNVDDSVALSCSTGEIASTVDFDGGDLGRAVITSPTSTTLFFDRRGILRNPSSELLITVADRSGGNAWSVAVSPTGRAEINR